MWLPTARVLKPTFVPTPRDRQEILVAEDFPLNRDVVKLMLDDTMFKPIFAKHGQEAVDIYMADPHRFPVILMDVSMPVMDGYAATRAIRAQERTAKRAPIPVIALTGHAMTSDQKDCEDAGMTDYLSKPVRQSALLEKLESYTGMAINIRQAV